MKGKSFTAFRSAAEEADTKRDNDARRLRPAPNEGGHMSSTGGRVAHFPGAELPYVAILAHNGRESTEHAFATMREAEAFIKRNTPLPRAASTTYDRPAPEPN